MKDPIARFDVRMEALEGRLLSQLDTLAAILQDLLKFQIVLTNQTHQDLDAMSEEDWQRLRNHFPESAYFRYVFQSQGTLTTLSIDLRLFRDYLARLQGGVGGDSNK